MANLEVTARRTGRPARFEVRVNSISIAPEVLLSTRSGLSAGPPAVIAASLGNSVQDEENPTALTDWIRLISEVCVRGANSTLNLARLMNRARQSLSYGQWSQLWQLDQLPFSKRKGEMLVVIGQCVERIDVQHSAQLPQAWNTLYYLARLGQRTVERLIEQGRIHPSLSLREAQALLAKHRPTLCKGPRSKFQGRLARFAAFVRANLKTLTKREREWAGRQLQVLAEEARAASDRLPSDSQTSVRILSQQGSVIEPLGNSSVVISKL